MPSAADNLFTDDDADGLHKAVEERANRIAKIGMGWLAVCACCMGIGRVAIEIFFPHMIGAGLTPTALMILVPIWGIGILGLLICTAAWVIHPYRDKELSREQFSTRRPDGTILGPWTKRLGGCLSGLMFVTFIAVMLDEWETTAWFAPWVFLPPLGFAFYLCWFYRANTHRATTTYLNLFGALFGVAFLPFIWPLMVVLLVLETPRKYPCEGVSHCELTIP